MVKRHFDHQMRTRNFQARNERIETGVLVKTRKGKNVSVEGKQKDCYQWKAKGQFTEGDACSLLHDDSRLGKVTQSFFPSAQDRRHRMTEEDPRKEVLPEAAVLLEGKTKKRADITSNELYESVM